ncbi:putative LRR receptor-like serine/threonine-protein kinase, partial [Mucuna pruriens]
MLAQLEAFVRPKQEDLGNRVLEDFDIKKEAGGFSFRSVKKQFRFEVSKNYFEIPLFWAGKGTCCIPTQGTYGPLIQAIEVIPDFSPNASNESPSTKKSRTSLIIGIFIGVVSFLLILIFCIIQSRKPHDGDEGKEVCVNIRIGTLNDGGVIAVKQLSVGSHQGKSQFITEIATISAVQHRNLVKLYGLVFKGVKDFLSTRNHFTLSWSTRYDICLAIARGLTYLHEESRLRIVHLSNILLDHELMPKISDFGFAKLYDDKMTHMSTRVAGTIGYLAPEYAMRGYLTEKADVFSIGVVSLELVSGRPNSYSSLEGEKVYLLEWAWQLHESNRITDLVDPRLSKFNEEEVKRIVGIVLLCTQASPALRPSMSRDIKVSNVTTKPGYLTDWNFEDVTSFMTDTIIKGSYTCYENSPASTSIVANAYHSPISVSKPILRKTIVPVDPRYISVGLRFGLSLLPLGRS